MYTVHKNVQVILALLKAYGVQNIVVSAGTRLIPLVFSAEEDNFFKCYSIVDERSAGFFALGLIERLQKPVAIVCTSGTATCNYVSAVAEAFYQHLPLIVLTSDRNHYYLNQQEDQCVPQKNLYNDIVRKSVDIPIVRDDMDFWYCNRLVNEALLELDHREKGPVHINFQIDDSYPIEKALYKFEVPTLPPVIKIDRIMSTDSNEKWNALANELKGKRVLILWGQHLPLSKNESTVIQTFCEQFGALATSDVIGNLHIKNFARSNWFGMLDNSNFESIMPDVIITMNANRLLNIKGRFKNAPQTLVHWHVSPNGEVSDPLKRQSKIIECTPLYFFKRLMETGIHNNKDYYKEWKDVENATFEEHSLIHHFEYSAVSAIQALISNMQDNALFHISNSNNIRIANNFDIPKTVDIYCNRGTCGIDGSTSSYIAQSYASNVPSYMIVGDLSFFYDMNSIWNRYIGKARIMLINNSCGALFHSAYYDPFKGVRDVDVNVAAAHHATAKGWTESQGFQYLSVRSQTELEQAIKIFTDPNAKTPLFMEVFTDTETDIAQIKELSKCSLKGTLLVKNKIKEVLPSSVVNVLKKLKK
ncbi:2-succinyl-5-enolpyruvyl-6-hydroxy-3-cyclohexene-1-carboxylic-acid synthase [uncultured Bacteroides sp.]|uniref:2-succinyl-5-enolpyruvyl-6-hydroxy-3- cyclohexene-1-carboxylic-acid synthase n=1 Tax=uncultured Bacteroides sp. TaxID=162156 RepID=UPI00280C2434|nr:2-succinyl-5-enolpyruvyl-6-hydroxy-3-cyclohexene-1-carboxylic-acid synthase [uncultured Bacteroides sp.]